jgi:hypothetical protein
MLEAEQPSLLQRHNADFVSQMTKLRVDYQKDFQLSSG